MERIAGLTRKVFDTAAELLAGESPHLLALRDGVGVKAIYERRRVFQQSQGWRLPASRRGRRPLKPMPTHDEFIRTRQMQLFPEATPLLS